MTLNIAVMASTRGTDMQAVIDGIESGELKDINLALVLTNKESGAAEKARSHNLNLVILESKGMEREDYDKKVIELMKENNIDLILFIGWMKIITPLFVKTFENKIMNIHPSLLPAFAGGMDLNVHEEILKRGCKVTGCTLHFVDEGADTGPIIMQKVVEVEYDDTPDTLKERVQKAEQEVIVEALKLYRDGKIKVEGNKVRILK